MHTERQHSATSGREAKRFRAGMTLIELLIALALTAMIGVAVTGMLMAMSQGTEYRQHAVAAAVSLHLADARLSDALRASKMVLAQGEDYIVLWKGDATGDNAPNLSELHRIERDAETGELVSYQSPADMSSDLDPEYDMNADFNSVTAALRGHAQFPEQVWARDVTAWTVTLDQPMAQDARLISYRLTVTRNGVAESRATAAALRNVEAQTP